MNEKICLSLFDVRLGPLVLFTRDMGDEEAQNVAMKSILALCGMENVIEEDIDGILPLPDQDIVFYAYIFPLKLNEEIRNIISTTATLAILVPRSAASALYQNVASLQYQAKEITNKIRENFIYKPGLSLPKSLQKLLTGWQLDKRILLERTTVTEKFVIEPSKPESGFKGSLALLYRLLKRDLDKIARAVIQGESLILVTDDPVLIENFTASLAIFAPHRLLNIHKYTDTFVDPSNYDIIGIPNDLLNHYTSSEFSTCTVVDLNKERVLRGRGDLYIRNLLKQSQSLPTGEAENHIQEKIKQNVLDSIELVNACLDPETGMEKILLMQKNMNRNEFNLVVEMALALNPAAKSLEELRGRIESAIVKLRKF
ncbi:MAG: hypothetical protein ACFFBD_02390 [Candidatus Hodarchaeota archaeon]